MDIGKLNKKSIMELIKYSTGFGIILGTSLAVTEISFSGITKETGKNFIKYPIRSVLVSNMFIGSIIGTTYIFDKVLDF